MPIVEFSSGNSQALRGILFEPSSPPPYPVIVLAHGFLSSLAEFGSYPHDFARRGYLSLAFDFRGCGTSDGQRGLVSEERMVQDLQAALDFVTKLPIIDPDRIALLGHSLGGSGVICAAARGRGRVRAVVAAATVNNLLDEVSPIEMLFFRFLDAVNRAQKLVTNRSIYVPYRVSYQHIFQDEDARKRAEAISFLQTSTPVDNLRLLTKQNTIRCAHELRVPTLIVRAEMDRVVKPASARRVFDAIASEKDWYEVPGSGHSFQTDCAGAAAFEHIVSWLDAKMKGSSNQLNSGALPELGKSRIGREHAQIDRVKSV